MTVNKFIETTYPILKDRALDKVEKECEDGIVKGYWAGTIIRYDIKPRPEE
jgi:hypothetical protein